MDWVKVAKALDDEWDRHRQIETMRPNDPRGERSGRLADIAAMLRDVLVAGMSPEERARMDADAAHSAGKSEP